MATVTARVPDEKKKQAMLLAKELWVPLWSLINIWINDFLRTQSINVSLDDTYQERYENKDMIEVNESIEDFSKWIKQIIAKRKKNG